MHAQKIQLTVSGSTEQETRVLDSVGYAKEVNHENEAATEVKKLSEKLERLGYLDLQYSLQSAPPATLAYQFRLGIPVRLVHLYIGKQEREWIGTSEDTLLLPFIALEDQLKGFSKKLENQGYPLASVTLQDISHQGSILKARLSVIRNEKRTVNEVIIEGYPKFPVGFRKNINRNYVDKPFSRETISKIEADFRNLRFVKQVKAPEVLFMKDSTKAYVFVEKSKCNTFDGFLGFGNSETGATRLAGYLDLQLTNILNSGEQIAVKWRSDGKDQKTFQLETEFPYILKTPIALQLQLHIFRQDSTFQNSKSQIGLGYYFRNNSKLFLNYRMTESSDIQNRNSALLSDYESTFFTASYTFSKVGEDYPFEPVLDLQTQFGSGSRKDKITDNNQLLGRIEARTILKLNSKNHLFIANQSAILVSDRYLTNELFRFGGIQSIRGFAENSLQADKMTLFMTEYRYKISPGIYIHTLTDFGFYSDKTTEMSRKPFGFGIGTGIRTQNGLLKIIYANSTDNKQVIQLRNSIIHINFKTFF